MSLAHNTHCPLHTQIQRQRRIQRQNVQKTQHMLYFWKTEGSRISNMTLRHHLRIISTSSAQHQRIISASPVHHQRIISALSVHHQRIFSASSDQTREYFNLADLILELAFLLSLKSSCLKQQNLGSIVGLQKSQWHSAPLERCLIGGRIDSIALSFILYLCPFLAMSWFQAVQKPEGTEN